jgi:GTP-binding protein
MKSKPAAAKTGRSREGKRVKDAPNVEAPPKKRQPLPIHHLDFLGGMVEAGGWRPPGGMPEIAFSGRSNVGKSSLLNKLVRRKAFARVSRTPGRTQEINFFSVNKRFALVDLPGYGYAKVSKEKKGEWGRLIEGYLRHSPDLKGVVQLLDARHEPTEQDLGMFQLLAELGIPTLVAVTKIDKLSSKERAAHLDALAITCGLAEDQMIPCSAVTGEGRDELAASLEALLEAATAGDAAPDDEPELPADEA